MQVFSKFLTLLKVKKPLLKKFQHISKEKICLLKIFHPAHYTFIH